MSTEYILAGIAFSDFLLPDSLPEYLYLGKSNNHWMVEYDIICVLKGCVGYSSWTDVPVKQRGLCYKNYNQSVTLPEWDIEQERY